ncbi:MAG: ShlB/FhaC/HecB family hemolysin secretion/activation protein [Methylococcaceae bacterium]|nr:ShlB/FhaC/HecB family hemolysin secretion/activation protein [Methylococcaceae bacterium]
MAATRPRRATPRGCVSAWAALCLVPALALAIDPYTDPTRPSNQPPQLPNVGEPVKENRLEWPAPPTEAAAPAAAGAGTVRVERVVFEGNRAIGEAELQELAKPFLHRALTAEALERLRYRVSLYYVKQGYINSGAVIPEQTVDAGVLRLKVIEGRLGSVNVKGQGWLRPEYIAGRLQGDAEEPLNTRDLQERYLRLLNDPLVERLNGTLLPGVHPGEAILDLKVVRARPWGGYIGMDNASTPYVDSYTGRFGAWLRNATGFGDRIDFNYSISGGANSYNTGLDLPLNRWGTTLSFRYTDSETTLMNLPEFESLFENLLNHLIGYDAQLSHPFWFSGEDRLTLGMNFGVRIDEPIDRTSGRVSQVLRRNQEAVLRLWQDYLHQGHRFDLAVRSTFSAGFDMLGATVPPTRKQGEVGLEGDPRFFAWLGQGVGRYRLLDNGAHLALNAAVQVTNDHLLGLERMAIGGMNSVRGFRQNFMVKDEAFYASLELAYPLFGAGSRHSLYVVPFMDYGGGWNQGEKGEFIQSAGIGLEYTWSTLTASFYWAGRINGSRLPKDVLAFQNPQAKRPYDAQDNGLHFQVNWRIP